MNKNLYVMVMTILIPVYLYAEDRSETSLSGSFGKVKHNHSINTNDGELVKSILDRGAVTYEYVWTGEKRAVIKKTNDQGKVNLLSIGGENEIQLGGSAGSIPLDRWTVLLDVSESAENLRLLFRCPQTFLYAEFSRKYPELKVPEGDQLIKMNDRFDDYYWKPHFYVNFLPNGFFKEGADIESFDAKLSENGSIRIARKSGMIDEYKITRDSIDLHGNRISDLRIWKPHKLESEIVNNLSELMAGSDLRWTSRLLTLIEDHSIDEEGNLKGREKRVISSIRDRALATAYEKRIRSEYLKMKENE